MQLGMMFMQNFLMLIILNLFKLKSMSSIRVNVKTKAIETLKLSNKFRSYLFEQEYDELSNCTHAQKKTLRDALAVLDLIIKNSK